MGWKYLEVLIAKMMLGTRKKVHHARQNQKAFWSRGCGVSSRGLGLGSSVWQAPTAPVSAGLGQGRCLPQVLLIHPPGALMSTSPYECPALTQGSAIMSHRITRPLSRAPERGWQVAMC